MTTGTTGRSFHVAASAALSLGASADLIPAARFSPAMSWSSSPSRRQGTGWSTGGRPGGYITASKRCVISDL